MTASLHKHGQQKGGDDDMDLMSAVVGAVVGTIIGALFTYLLGPKLAARQKAATDDAYVRIQLRQIIRHIAHLIECEEIYRKEDKRMSLNQYSLDEPFWELIRMGNDPRLYQRNSEKLYEQLQRIIPLRFEVLRARLRKPEPKDYNLLQDNLPQELPLLPDRLFDVSLERHIQDQKHEDAVDVLDDRPSDKDALDKLRELKEELKRTDRLLEEKEKNLADRIKDLLCSRARVQQKRPDIKWVRDGCFRALSVAFSPDGGLLALGSWDGARSIIGLWQVSNWALVRTLDGETSKVTSVAFSPDGQLLASGNWATGNTAIPSTIKLWRVSDGELVHTLTGHTGGVYSVAFSPDGELLASGSEDGTAKLWRVSDGELVRSLEGQTGGVLSVAFSPDGKLLASGSEDGTIKLWRVSDGELVRSLEGQTGGVLSVAFSPDGKLLASGSEDGTIKLWQVANGGEVRTLSGHTDWVWSVAFSPDGQLLASGSSDGTIKLWGVSDGKLLQTYDQETGTGVRSIQFSPDGRLFAYGRRDATVVVARNPFYRGSSGK
jgi:predicted NACHT family NTPase